MVSAHRLAEERSLALHRAVADKLASDPETLERARARVRSWLESAEVSPHWARAWDEILSRPLPEILAFLVDESEQARALRQATPFAGAIDPRTRWRIWRSARSDGARPMNRVDLEDIIRASAGIVDFQRHGTGPWENLSAELGHLAGTEVKTGIRWQGNIVT